MKLRRLQFPLRLNRFSGFFQSFGSDYCSRFFLFLLLGLCCGCLFGLYGAPAAPLLRSDLKFFSQRNDVSFWTALLDSSRYALMALILSTGILGIVFLPILSVLRGFTLGCSVAVLFSAYRYAGLAAAAVSVGVPALIGLPPFILLVSDGFRFSAELFPFAARNSFVFHLGRFLKKFCFVVLFLLAETVYCIVLRV